MTDQQPEPLDLRSHDLTADKTAELLRLFPEIRTEGGKIDFDKLKLTLGASVDVGRERYGMTWPGKADCFKTIQAPSIGTLLPARAESVDFDSTENLIIEGDNLEVLKLLQKSYLGKVKMIYIDPPYNTGNDFIYPDNYSESLQTYLEYTGQVDEVGRKFGTNSDTDGRFHSRWLNMMYPRLYLAKNLLRDDGVIFISIDDAEIDNLRKLCDEIFGEENFVAQLVWEKGRKNDAKLFSVGHEYILVYSRLKDSSMVWREEKPGAREILSEYRRLKDLYGNDLVAIQKGIRHYYDSLPKDHPALKHRRYNHIDVNGIWRDHDISWPSENGPRYEIIHPKTKQPCRIPDRGWRFSTIEKFTLYDKHGFIEYRDDHTEPPILKRYLNYVSTDFDLDTRRKNISVDGEEEEVNVQVMPSVFYKHSQPTVVQLRNLMGGDYFPNPKDSEILGRLAAYVTDKDSIILDFFAGSGTTAQAVLDLNHQDGSNRKFILVQLPEPIEDKEFPTIADITKERVRRVIQKMNAEEAGQLPLHGKQDRGFRVFKLAESNFKSWDAQAPQNAQALEKQLELHIDHIREGRSAEDILYEILLKSGFALTTPVENLTLAGKSVYSVVDGGMLICLEKQLTLELIRAMAEHNPQRVVCLDAGFAGDDQLKTNAVQIFKTKNITFKTV